MVKLKIMDLTTEERLDIQLREILKYQSIDNKITTATIIRYIINTTDNYIYLFDSMELVKVVKYENWLLMQTWERIKLDLTKDIWDLTNIEKYNIIKAIKWLR